MSQQPSEVSKDPRIRRTQGLLQSALSKLLEEKQFRDISITDICNQADVARVTFYQHYESKEALLVTSVANFFANIHHGFDQSVLAAYLETGDMRAIKPNAQMNVADQKQLRLIRAALQHAGTAVRELTLASFLETYPKHETGLNQSEIEMLGTFYVGGMLSLLEQFLSGQLTSVSHAELQSATLTLLYASKQGIIQSRIFRDLPTERHS